MGQCINTLRPRQNGRHFPDDIFRCILLNGNVWISNMFSLKFVPTVRMNTLRPRQNGRHFADDIFKLIFVNENVWIPIRISLKLVPQAPINNIPALVQIMAWRRPGDKPLSGPMMVRLPTHICVTRPQWVNNIPALVQIMAWRRPGHTSSMNHRHMCSAHVLPTISGLSRRFVVFCFYADRFYPYIQSYVTGIGAIIRLP